MLKDGTIHSITAKVTGEKRGAPEGVWVQGGGIELPCNTRVSVLFYGLIRRACKFSVNFYGSCKDHFKPLFNPPPISSFSWSLKTHFIGSFRYFIIYFCMYKILSKTPLEGDEKNYCSRSK